jgi:hypothetical protein
MTHRTSAAAASAIVNDRDVANCSHHRLLTLGSSHCGGQTVVL